MSRGKKEDLYQLPIRGVNGEVVMTLSLNEDIAEQIHSREDLIKLVNYINTEISCLNQTLEKKEKLEIMSLDMVLKRYDKMEISRVRSEFRIAHDCYYCLYWSGANRCKAEKYCPLDDEGEMEKPKLSTCSKDLEMSCPYGNEVGTCFGFCMREILMELKQKMNNRSFSG